MLNPLSEESIGMAISNTPPVFDDEEQIKDYTKDGILYCGECHTPKQVKIMTSIIPCACKCALERYEAEHKEAVERERRYQIERNRKEAFMDASFSKCTFANDDNSNPELSKLCFNYAKRFKPDTKGLILYGGTGIGKTFMAACIANEVLEAGYTVRFTTVSEFETKLWNAQGKAGLYDEYCKCGLLVIDDVGSERDSKYMTEVLFNIVDRRIRTGKTLLITTNLEPDAIFKASGIEQERVMSRLLENGAPYKCKGSDRRIKKSFETSKAFVNSLLSDE